MLKMDINSTATLQDYFSGDEGWYRGEIYSSPPIPLMRVELICCWPHLVRRVFLQLQPKIMQEDRTLIISLKQQLLLRLEPKNS